jgi:hypothetical protein
MLLACGGCNSQPAPVTWRFVTANDRLFAIEEGNGYGTERSVHTSDDLGESWRPFDAPARTHSLAGDGHELFALTSTGEIWRRGDDRQPWTVIKRGARREYLYGILASSAGKLIVTEMDAVTIYDRDGTVLHRFASPNNSAGPLERERFVDSQLADADERHVIVEANPYALYVIDLDEAKLVPWAEGLDARPPQGLHGPCRVCRHGDRYLLRSHDGIHVADGLLQPWRPLVQPSGGFMTAGPYRSLLSFDADRDQWLLADNRGIQLMRGGQEVKTVFADRPDPHDLIQQITPYRDEFFVSFYRLKDGCVGVRLAGDLSDWTPIFGQRGAGR